MVLPAVMILTGIVSVQFGAGLAYRLFGQVPPAAVTGLRLWTSAVAMVAISGRGFTRSVRDLRRRRAVADAAIATGFERRYGVLKRLGATPLSRTGLISAKTATVIAVELLQCALILIVARAIGWRPDASATAIVVVPLLILLGTAAFSGLGLLMAGTLRAEATLAAANLVYVVLLGVGGVVFSLNKFPADARPVLELLPTGALSTGLRAVLQQGVVFPVGNAVTLAVWAVAAITLAARTFKWD